MGTDFDPNAQLGKRSERYLCNGRKQAIEDIKIHILQRLENCHFIVNTLVEIFDVHVYFHLSEKRNVYIIESDLLLSVLESAGLFQILEVFGEITNEKHIENQNVPSTCVYDLEQGLGKKKKLQLDFHDAQIRDLESISRQGSEREQLCAVFCLEKAQLTLLRHLWQVNATAVCHIAPLDPLLISVHHLGTYSSVLGSKIKTGTHISSLAFYVDKQHPGNDNGDRVGLDRRPGFGSKICLPARETQTSWLLVNINVLKCEIKLILKKSSHTIVSSLPEKKI